MNILLIFIFKTIENILTTLRIIILSNHKKLIAASLNFVITIIWIFSTAIVLKNFTHKPIYILVYAIGCFIGSYLGCLIEEKLAIGENMLTCITKDDSIISSKLREYGYLVTTIDGYNLDSHLKVLLIMIPRKKKYRVIHLIKLLDSKAKIISENASYIEKKLSKY